MPQAREQAGTLALFRGNATLPAPGAPVWSGIAADCVAESMAGAALTRLASLAPEPAVPVAARGTLEAEVGRVRVAQTLLFHRFEALADLLDRVGVPFIVHKGAVLAPLVYPRLEDRPMVDVDILIRPDAWRQVRDAIVSSGYRLPEGAHQEFWLENYFNLSVRSPEDPASHFDLHWSLTQEGRYHIDTEDLFARAVPYQLGARRLLRLSNEDLLLSLFLHLAYHYFDAHLIWLYDMKLVIERLPIDWDLLLRRARRWRLMTVVAFNFAYLEKVFPGVVPSEVAARARRGIVRRMLAAPLLSASPRHLFRSEENRLNQFLIGLLAIDRPADAAGFAAGKISRSLRWAGRRPKRR